MTGRLGVCFGGNMPIKDIVECTKTAEDQGLDTAWMTDLTPLDAYVPLTACALATRKIKLGTGISVAALRHPLVVAAAVACLDEVSDKRVVLGIGTGGIPAKQVGIKFDKPVQAMREYVEVLRKFLTGEAFSYEGKVYKLPKWTWWNLHRYRPLRDRVPIYIAAIGGRMMELAGEIGDGLFMGTINPITYVSEANKRLLKGASHSGRSSETFDIVNLAITSVARNSAAAKKVAKIAVATYSSFFAYKPVLEYAGYSRERQQIVEAMSRGDVDAAVKAVSDRMVDDLTVAGTPEECRSKIEEYWKAGVDQVNIYANLTGLKNLKTAYLDAIKALA